MDFLRRILGKGGAPAESGGDDARRERSDVDAKGQRTELSPEDRRANPEKAQKIVEMAQRAAEHIEHIAERQVQDVPALEGRFAQVEGLWSMAEDLYTGMQRPAGIDLTFSGAESAIGRLRRYKEALDRARSAHRAYELYPKTYRSGGDLEMRSDFDATTRPMQEHKARDPIAGSKRLREVMGI